MGRARKGVGIYYKELESSYSTASDFVSGWSENDFYMVQPNTSAYSTISIQKDGKIAFLYENIFRNDGYNGEFVILDLKTITKGKY